MGSTGMIRRLTALLATSADHQRHQGSAVCGGQRRVAVPGTGLGSCGVVGGLEGSEERSQWPRKQGDGGIPMAGTLYQLLNAEAFQYFSKQEQRSSSKPVRQQPYAKWFILKMVLSYLAKEFPSPLGSPDPQAHSSCLVCVGPFSYKSSAPCVLQRRVWSSGACLPLGASAVPRGHSAPARVSPVPCTWRVNVRLLTSLCLSSP